MADRPIILKLIRNKEYLTDDGSLGCVVGHITMDGKKIFDTIENETSRKDGYKYKDIYKEKYPRCIPEGRYFIKLLKTTISDSLKSKYTYEENDETYLHYDEWGKDPLCVQGKYLEINNTYYMPIVVKTSDSQSRTMTDLNYGNEYQNTSNIYFYAGFSKFDTNDGIVICNNPNGDAFTKGKEYTSNDSDDCPWNDNDFRAEALRVWMGFVDMIVDYRVCQKKDIMLIVKNQLD